MKYVFIVLISLMSGCASMPSEYNQGCRDGVTGVTSYTLPEYSKKAVDKYCNDLDQAYQSKKRMNKEMGRQ
jgi:hypothetical protein